MAPRDLRAELGLPRARACWCSPGASPTEKKHPVLIEAFRLLGHPYHLLLIGGDDPAAPATSRACRIAATIARSPPSSAAPMPSCTPARTKPSAW
jgi:hypothetical protein